MADNNNIKDFTVADIEKYWGGKLSPAEMHAMENAAMDDPFLADALEGYKHSASPTEDLKLLQEKLDKRTASVAPVISLQRKKYSWLKVAAAVIVICGIGLIFQQLVLKDRQHAPIVGLENKETNKSEAPVTSEAVKPDSTVNVAAGADSSSFKHDIKISAGLSGVISDQNLTTDTLKDADRLTADVKKEGKEENVTPGISANAVTNAEIKQLSEDKVALSKSQPDTSKLFNANRSRAETKQNDADYFLAGRAAGIVLNNKYNYRVVDVQNNPVPFANVTSTRDNVGTYTDVRGNFNLISTDSVLDVQVRSLGYNSANYKLVPSSKTGDLVLKEDEEARRQILAQNRKVVSNITRKDSTELEEPEVGWGNYNTYVANNIQIPDNIRAKNTRSDVELSFDIDKSGHPTNIKVTRSSQCKACDEEAIRLLKEGPKWKRRGKKSKTTISIAVDQK